MPANGQRRQAESQFQFHFQFRLMKGPCSGATSAASANCELFVSPQNAHTYGEGGNRIYSPRFGVATPTTRGQQRCDT